LIKSTPGVAASRVQVGGVGAVPVIVGSVGAEVEVQLAVSQKNKNL
jgi:hypothetical protein